MPEPTPRTAMLDPVHSGAAWILARCDELSAYSSNPDRLERVYLSPEHRAVNALVAGWMHEAGLAVREDAAGNLIGRLEGARLGAPAVIVGSHLDTVPDAGRYDGTLGVLLGIAVARRLDTRGTVLPFALEVVAFWDEEGARFGTALFGSKAMSGTLEDGWRGIADAGGVTIEQAFRDYGLDPDMVETAARDPRGVVAYLEPHIEQRPFLDRAGDALGVVTRIAGAQRMLWRVVGESRHAGTPYDLRRDALLGASAAIVAVAEVADGLPGMATIGSLTVHPNAVNIVPGAVEFSLDYRSISDAECTQGVERLAEVIRKVCAAHELRCSVTTTHKAAAVLCSPRLRGVLGAAIESTGQSAPLELQSIAGHDAMAMADLAEVGMLFIRCTGGISHSPEESVVVDDVVAALDAIDHAVGHVMDQGLQ